MPHIKFNIDEGLVDYLPHPKPAGKFIPSWYKKMRTITQDIEKQGDATLKVDTPTVKKCTPVRDYLTSGYIIPYWTDTLIRRDSKGFFVDISPARGEQQRYNSGISWHGLNQVRNSPLAQFTDTEKLVKVLCPWTVITPKGYSTLFFSPFYHEADITILPAIVDTDRYSSQTNFPAIVTGKECRLNIGDPLIQAIPFKREDWTSSVTTKDLSSKNIIMGALQGFDSLYTRHFWRRKRYR